VVADVPFVSLAVEVKRRAYFPESRVYQEESCGSARREPASARARKTVAGLLFILAGALFSALKPAGVNGV
jgi:hypothetical protein